MTWSSKGPSRAISHAHALSPSCREGGRVRRPHLCCSVPKPRSGWCWRLRRGAAPSTSAVGGCHAFNPPLIGTAQRQAGAVHQQMQGLGVATSVGAYWLRPRHPELDRLPAQRRMAWHAERQVKRVDDRTDKSLCLPTGKAEHGAQRDGRRDRQKRIPGLASARCTRLRLPRRDRFIFKDPFAVVPSAVGTLVRERLRPILFARSKEGLRAYCGL